MKLKKHHKITIWISGVIVGLLVIAGLWLYTGSLSNTKISFFALLRAPIAIVDGQIITANAVRQKLQLAGSLDGQFNITHAQAFEAVLRDASIASIAEKYDTVAPDELIELAYAQALKASQQNEEQFVRSLEEQYHLNSHQFKERVLRPIYTEIWLRSWYAKNQTLQRDNTKRIEDLQIKIQNGNDFEVLAKQYSQDEATTPLGGNLGFLAEHELLPELALALSSTEKGSVIIAGSRLGLHLIQVDAAERSSTETLYETKQIFLKAGGFEDWLQKEQEKVSQYTFAAAQ